MRELCCTSVVGEEYNAEKFIFCYSFGQLKVPSVTFVESKQVKLKEPVILGDTAVTVNVP
jgi:hypothetical protein